MAWLFKNKDGYQALYSPGADMPGQVQALINQWLANKQEFELQTSGSTGVPKTIVLTREKIAYSARLTASTFGLMPGDVLFCCLGPDYIAGFMMVMRALVIGCDLLVENPSSNPLAHISADSRIDFAAFVPLQMESMLQDTVAVQKLNSMKAVLLGGAPVSAGLDAKMQILQVPVYHTYSMTETYTHVAIRRINGLQKSLAYKPLSGVSLSTDDRQCLVASSFLTDNQPLTTNDVVEMQPDGSFIWIGRYDNVINSGGVKIQLEKTESAVGEIFRHFNINSAFFAAGLPDEKLGQKLVLIVEGESWPREMIHNVNDQLSIVLSKYELPKDILFVKTILKTRTGKIDREQNIRQLDIKAM